MTDIPEIDILAEEQSHRKNIKVEERKKKEVKKQILRSSNINDKEYYYLVCEEAYSERFSGESGFTVAHAKCTSSAIFVGINCKSD